MEYSAADLGRSRLKAIGTSHRVELMPSLVRENFRERVPGRLAFETMLNPDQGRALRKAFDALGTGGP